jgi:citrate lyase beta subunit
MRKAVASAADVCIFDLEDSVAPDRLGEARGTVAQAVEELGGNDSIWVRVHSPSSREMTPDLESVPLDRVAAVVVPKVASADEMAQVRVAIRENGGAADLPIVPIIESAPGVVNVGGIASTPGILCLALGRFDLSADLGIDPDGGSPALSAARAAVVLHSAAAGLRPPLDSPWLRIKDLDALGEAARRARGDGFGGMLLIHPSHVPIVNEVFSPTAEEIAWATDIVASADQAAADGRGVYARDGAMVDEAIVRRARAILAHNSGAA